MFDQDLLANLALTVTFFTYDMLNRYNVLEHDTSMSRSDAYFGNSHIFNQPIFNTTSKYEHAIQQQSFEEATIQNKFYECDGGFQY
ncbi:hypothetical protein AC578_3456 [Pseudocercospora eumusae]|uniref:Heme haloperoxidase family profile domain-containing protein n=1 Tax=Pseudocercospora eumusae TaxID=321146 RepID=A0A139HRC7_9PEZI|nr:hypothetical protein AC578_3456 [Pseudocercospora eumusae]